MTATASAAIVAAGTAVVLAPITPQTARHALDSLPEPAPAPAPAPAPELPSSAAILLAHTELLLAVRVRTALSLRGYGIRGEEGETARRVTVWSQYELNAVYERVGGTVTTRTVQRSTYGSESTWEATEITVTVDLPSIGTVEICTDWFEEYGGRDLPLMRAIPDATLIPA